MLQVEIAEIELYDERTEEFVVIKPTVLRLEHSLVSISKWEAKWKKPFLTRDSKTYEESVDYVRCMTLNQNVNPNVYYGMSGDNWDEINKYIDAQMTATWFRDRKKSPNRMIVTSEWLYYQMVVHGIPFECQKWHISRLLTLIRICNTEATKQKMPKNEVLKQNRALNEARKRKLNTNG